MRKAFTLAETLIVIAIIGIVAGILIQNVIANIQEKQSISSLKKIYSELSQVNLALNAEYNGNWTDECQDFDDKCFRDLFATQIKTLKICNRPIFEGCQNSSLFLNKSVTGGTFNVNDDWPGFMASSGYSLKFRFHLHGCNSSGYNYSDLNCGWIQVDTNGLKAPNIVGKDIFYLQFYSDGTIKGTRKGIINMNGKYDASLSSYETLKNDCKNGTGISCSALYLMK